MPWPPKKTTTDPVVRYKKRFIDAQWRRSITYYYDILRRILPASHRQHKRKRGRARVLKAAMQHLKYMESTIMGLLGGRAHGNLLFFRSFFEHYVEQHSCAMAADMAKNAVALLLDENGVAHNAVDELIPLFRRERSEQPRTKIKPLEVTERSRVLSDITSSTINTSVAPSIPTQEGNTENDPNSEAEGQDNSKLTDENYFLEEIISLNIERVQVVPQDNCEWLPLISSLQQDHLHDDQLVPESSSDAGNILLCIKHGEVNQEALVTNGDRDPVLGSAHLGPHSPEKPPSAFGEVSWSSIEWMLNSDPEIVSSSQEVPEQ